MSRPVIGSRIARLEAERSEHRYVLRREPHETTEDALARNRARTPVAILPTPCATVEKWLERYAPKSEYGR